MGPPVDINELSLPNKKIVTPIKNHKPPHHKPGEKFIKGPIPWNWITRAGCLPGKALQVAVTIWFLAGIKRTGTIQLSNKCLRDIGVNRYSKNRALKSLEINRLVAVERHKGRSPVVTILEAQVNA
jgi:hypothetical protein